MHSMLVMILSKATLLMRKREGVAAGYSRHDK